MSLWRSDENYPSVVIGYPPALYTIDLDLVVLVTEYMHLYFRKYLSVGGQKCIVLASDKGLEQKAGFELRHDKTNKMTVHPAKTLISLGIRPVSSVFAVHSVGS